MDGDQPPKACLMANFVELGFLPGCFFHHDGDDWCVLCGRQGSFSFDEFLLWDIALEVLR